MPAVCISPKVKGRLTTYVAIPGPSLDARPAHRWGLRQDDGDAAAILRGATARQARAYSRLRFRRPCLRSPGRVCYSGGRTTGGPVLRRSEPRPGAGSAGLVGELQKMGLPAVRAKGQLPPQL